LLRYTQLSDALTQTATRAAETAPDDAGLRAALEEARWHLLRAETSCNIFWGEAWVDRADADLEAAEGVLRELGARFEPGPGG